jgi:putative restriction endonuclease
MFDVGLWSLDDDYRVLVATNRFDEAGDAAFLLKRMAGRPVQLPGHRDFWPDKAHLAWHREHRMGLAMSATLPQLGHSVSLTQLK